MLRKGFSLALMGLSQDSPTYHSIVNRNASIRSSEWAAVWGLNPYLSKYKYWHILKGKKERDSPPSFLPPLLHGHTEEPVSASLYEKKYLDKSLRIQKFGSRQYWEDPIYSASPDRLIVNDEGKVLEGLEIKNPFSKPIPLGVREEYYEELCHRVLQCFLCMAIFEVKVWNLFYTKNKTQEAAHFKVHWNQEFWDKELYPKSRNFFNSTQPPSNRISSEEKKRNAKWIMDNIRVELWFYSPPICEED